MEEPELWSCCWLSDKAEGAQDSLLSHAGRVRAIKHFATQCAYFEPFSDYWGHEDEDREFQGEGRRAKHREVPTDTALLICT